MALHIEVAHEALIQNWQRLDDWLDEDREYLLWRQSLRRNVDEWKAHKNDPDTLLRGTLLQTATEWESQRSEDLGPDEKAYIAESRNLESLLKQEKTWRRRWNVSWSGAAILLLIACVVIGWMASRSSKKTITASGYLGQASLHEQRGEYPAAIADYTEALKLNRDLPSAYLGRARVYYLQGTEENYRKAIADYNEFIKLVSESIPPRELAVAYDGRGQAYLQVNALVNARADFTFAIQVDPRFALAWYDLGSLLAQEGHFDQAIESYTKSIESDSGFYSAYIGRGKALFARDNTSKAEVDLEKALKDFEMAKSLKPNAAEPYLRIGLIHYERKEVKEAIELYQQALDHESHYAEASNALGQAYVQTGQLERAIPHFKDAAGRGYIRADYNLGLAYKAKGEYENAINSFLMFIANSPTNSPDNSEAFLSLGEAYALKGDYKTAIENYSKSIDLKPQQGDAYFSRGESYFKTGDKEKATNDFATFIKSTTSEPRLYQARQYLEQLDFVPPIDSVEIHLFYNKTMDEALVDKVKTALKEKKFFRIQPNPADSDLVGIRFFQNTFKTHAKSIRDIVQSVYASNNDAQDFKFTKFPDPKNKDAYGWIEIWLPASRPAVSPSTIPRP